MRKMGFHALMDVIQLDAALVGRSHGRATDDARDGPLCATSADGSMLPKRFQKLRRLRE
jgi:hypothetical protein